MVDGYVRTPDGSLHGPYGVSTGRGSMRGSTGIDELMSQHGPVPNGSMLAVGERVYEMEDRGPMPVADGPAGAGMVSSWTDHTSITGEL